MNPDNTPADKPFLHYEPLSVANKWWIGAYILYTLIVVFGYNRISYYDFLLIGYAVVPQLSFAMIIYGSLRNFRFYLVWVGFALLHLAMYYTIRGDPKLQMVHGSSAMFLCNTFPLLLVYQLVRLVSLKLQHKEWVAPNKGGDTDDFDHRKITAFDRVLFLCYFAVYGLLFYLSLPN